MTDTATRPSFPKRHPWLTGAAVIAALLIVLIIGLRFWVTTQWGHNFILSQINGREVAGYGTLYAEGMNGDPLSVWSLDKIQINDSEGTWITAEQVQVKWNPWGIASRNLELMLVSAESISIERQPNRAATSASSSKQSSWKVQVKQLDIDNLSLSESITGRPAEFRVSGSFNQQQSGLIEAKIDVSPLSDTDDMVHLHATRSAAGSISMDVDAFASADGPLAKLLKIPNGRPLTLKGSASGSVETGDGFIKLTENETLIADMTSSWSPETLSANLALKPDQLPVPITVADLLGGETLVSLEAGRNSDNAPIRLQATFKNGTLKTNGTYDPSKLNLESDLDVSVNLSDASAIIQQPASLMLDGTVRQDSLTNFEGRVRLTPAGGSTLPFETASGPLSVSLEDRRVPFSTILDVKGAKTGNEPADEILTPVTRLSVLGEWQLDQQVLTLLPSSVNTEDGRLKLEGRVDVSNKTLALTGLLDHSVAPLLSNASGRVSGPVRLSGTFDKPALTTRLSGKNLSGLPTGLDDVLGSTPSLAMNLTYTPQGISFSDTQLSGAAISADLSGRYALSGKSDLTLQIDQSQDILLGERAINIGNAEIKISGESSERRILVATTDGSFTDANLLLSDLALQSALIEKSGRISGPLNLTAALGDNIVNVSADIDRSDGLTKADNILATFPFGEVRGSVEQSTGTGLSTNFSATGENFTYSGILLGAFDGSLDYSAPSGLAGELNTNLNLQNVRLPTGLTINSISGEIQSAQNGYTFVVDTQREHPSRPIDLKMDGSIATNPALTAIANANGVLLGQSVQSVRPTKISLENGLFLDSALNLFGGKLNVEMSRSTEANQISFSLDNVDPTPIALMFGVPIQNIKLNGAGILSPYGLMPSGEFALSARSDIPDLDSDISLELVGQIKADRLQMNLSGMAAEALKLNIDATLPVSTASNALISLDKNKSVQTRAELTGELSGLRKAALAYGHDIGGTIDARFIGSGSVSDPNFNGTVKLTNGTYELGRTGMRLTDIELTTTHQDNLLSLSASGSGGSDGRFDVSGTLSDEQMLLNAKLRELPLYDRDDDIAIASGNLTFARQESDQSLTGSLNIDQARFDIDHLPGQTSNAIPVRWKDTPGEEASSASPTRPLKLDLSVKAPQQVYITGRGLNSEWRLDTKISGTLGDPRIVGDAYMVRADLDLAGRPFVFDTGHISFFGKPEDSALDISANRTVDGFTANVSITGNILDPDLELSSTPDLPQDEIISRLLFGRSAMDLSAIEIAQLASSLSRFTGSGESIDPTVGLQRALGVDRFSLGTGSDGAAEIGIGEYISKDVYLQVQTSSTDGSSFDVEWRPRDQLSVESSTTTTGETELSIKWKNDY